MPLALTQDEAIQKIQSRHGDRVDVSRVLFSTTRSKIEIGCTVCGCWWLSRADHVFEGRGCPPCSEKRRISNVSAAIKKRCLTLAEVQKQSVELHGDCYEFPSQIYINSQTKLKIKCKRCFEFFWQDVNHHIHRKQGCFWCQSLHFVSSGERCWLQKLNVPDDREHRQVLIDRYRVDGLLNGVVYEFYGRYYHGDPRAFTRDQVNHKNGLTMGSLYNATIARQLKLESLGYQVRFVWELDFDRGLLFSEKHPTYAT